MEELIKLLMQYGLSPQQAQAFAQQNLANRYTGAMGQAAPLRGYYERGLHDPGDPGSMGVLPPQSYIDQKRLLQASQIPFSLRNDAFNTIAAQQRKPVTTSLPVTVENPGEARTLEYAAKLGDKAPDHIKAEAQDIMTRSRSFTNNLSGDQSISDLAYSTYGKPGKAPTKDEQ